MYIEFNDITRNDSVMGTHDEDANEDDEDDDADDDDRCAQ